jgi:hypothetical protein
MTKLLESIPQQQQGNNLKLFAYRIRNGFGNQKYQSQNLKYKQHIKSQFNGKKSSETLT